MPPDTAGRAPAVDRPQWETVTGTSRTTLTTHLWTAPPLRRGSPVHDKAFDALRDLEADLVRFLPWFTHPRIAVPLNEIGSYPPDLMNPEPDIPAEYWALSASVQSYLWSELVALGVDLVGIAEFMDYPAMIPGTTLVDRETGEPNTRYHALALLLRHFGPGDRLVDTSTGHPGLPDARIHARAFETTGGHRKLLLVNRTAETVTVQVEGDAPREVDQVGTPIGDETSRPAVAGADRPVLRGDGVAVLVWS